ncbi:MAG: DUF2442 domain-containing protein [bacterium]
MLLEVISAKYLDGYRLFLSFKNGYKGIVDLKSIIQQEKRNIFKPLKERDYFKNFSIRFNTICWENEADLAPEFLYGLAKKQEANLVSDSNESTLVKTDLVTA